MSKIFLCFKSSDRLSICAKTFVPVMILALPYFFFIKLEISLSKKPFNVLIPLLFAILQIFSAGSTPNTLVPTVLKKFNRTPTLLPISTTKSSALSLNLFEQKMQIHKNDLVLILLKLIIG